MLDRNDDRTITALVDEVLTALRQNLKEHQEIVKEAREGYITKAVVALSQRMERLAEGDPVGLSFRLSPPTSHSKDFKTVIKMLELHKGAFDSNPAVEGQATIPLKAVDVQRYLLNDWSWMDTFLHGNAVYSEKAALLSSAM